MKHQAHLWQHKPDKSATLQDFVIEYNSGTFCLFRDGSFLGKFTTKADAQDYAEGLLMEGK